MPSSDTAAWDPLSWMQQWRSAMALVPNTLVQPILPGWTVNVNGFNSSAPQTENEVLQHHSYGRQLGRISDALALLVDERDADRTDTRFDDFRTMKEEIDAIKGGNLVARVERLLADLDRLKQKQPKDYARLSGELRKRLPPR
jgi:hypothetical protein